MRVLDILAYFFSISYSVGHAFAQNISPPIHGVYTFSTVKGDRQMATAWIDGKRKVVSVPVSLTNAPPVSRQWGVSSDDSVPPKAFIQNQNQFLVVKPDGVLDLVDSPDNSTDGAGRATGFNYFIGYSDQNPNILAYSFLDYGNNHYIVEGDAINRPDFQGGYYVTFDQKPDAAWILGPQ